MSDSATSPAWRGDLIAARDVVGTNVFNRQGETLGTINDVMIEKLSGRVAYVVLAAGGFLGIGDKHYPLPWNRLQYDETLGGFVIDMAPAELEQEAAGGLSPQPGFAS